MYVKPGETRPSPGSFHELGEVIRTFNLTPALLVAVVTETPEIDPYNGPRAVVLTITEAGEWGEVEFVTIAFRDRDFLIQLLHASGIHMLVTDDLDLAVAQFGPAAGEPDEPRLPTPVAPPPVTEPEPDPEVPPSARTRPTDDEVIVAEAPLT